MRRPPGPGTVGLLARLRRAGSPPALLADVAREFGDVALLRAGPVRLYLLSHPDHVEEVLQTHDDRFQRVPSERRVSGRIVGRGLFASEGDLHARERRLLEPVMYERAPAAHADTVVDIGTRVGDRLPRGEPFDLVDLMEKTTTDIMVRVLFGEDPTGPAAPQLADAVTGAIEAMNRLPLAFSRLADLVPSMRRRRFRLARAHLDSLIRSRIAERRAERGPDVLSMLLDAGGPDMPDALIRDELVTLFRGQQGVGAALGWTWYLLSEHPDVEARFHEEIDRILGGRHPTFGDVANLTFVRMVFAEALRLYPPAWVLARLSVADHEVEGYLIPRGARVLMSEWVVHRDPRWYPDPERFDPERFTPEARALRPRYAYFPQGGGPKRCMGMEFLPTEAVLLLATLGRRWRMRPVPGRPVRISPRVTLKPKGGLPVVAEPRG